MWYAIVVIDRSTFVARLRKAVSEAREFAAELLIDELPAATRYDLWLVPDFPDGETPSFAPEFAAFWQRSKQGRLASATEGEFVDWLWHTGRAPEWIELGVVDVDEAHAFIEARFSRTLVSHFPGDAPFNVRGPYHPPGYDVRSGGRFRIRDVMCWGREVRGGSLQRAERRRCVHTSRSAQPGCYPTRHSSRPELAS